MGGRSSKIEHDPGPEGESGEGDATIVMFCLMYVITIAVLVYEKFFKEKQLTAEEELFERKKSMGGEENPAKDPESTEEKTKEQQEAEDDAEADAIAQARWTEPV